MNEDLWVFGYGSLMWQPGFAVAESVLASLPGYARTFCMSSIHHRGTPERPGLVLALDRVEGASCRGLALRVEAGREDETLAYLRERELVSAAYLEARVGLHLADGREIEALAYVVDPHHVQYSTGVTLEEQARIIAGATGGRGPNSEYLFNTTAHLAELGIRDGELEWLADRVRQILAERAG